MGLTSNKCELRKINHAEYTRYHAYGWLQTKSGKWTLAKFALAHDPPISSCFQLIRCKIIVNSPFLFFTTNQFKQKFNFSANLITYFVNMYNIYKRRHRLWCMAVSLLLSHWYPGSGVVLDCIHS